MSIRALLPRSLTADIATATKARIGRSGSTHTRSYPQRGFDSRQVSRREDRIVCSASRTCCASSTRGVTRSRSRFGTRLSVSTIRGTRTSGCHRSHHSLRALRARRQSVPTRLSAWPHAPSAPDGTSLAADVSKSRSSALQRDGPRGTRQLLLHRG